MPYLQVEDTSDEGFHLELDNRGQATAIVGFVDLVSELPELDDVMIGALYIVRSSGFALYCATSASEFDQVATAWTKITP